MKYKTIDVTTPLEGRVVYKGRWWLCKDGDPTQAVFYQHSPQCNNNELIPRSLLAYTQEKSGWEVQAIFIPVAFVPTARE